MAATRPSLWRAGRGVHRNASFPHRLALLSEQQGPQRPRPPRPASLRRMGRCARTQDGRPPPVSQTGFEAAGLLVKMASAYLTPPRSLPSANMAAAPLLLPTAVKPVCPQSRWRPPASGGAPWCDGCGEGTGRRAGLAAGWSRERRGEGRLRLPPGRGEGRSSAARPPVGSCAPGGPVKWRVGARSLPRRGGQWGSLWARRGLGQGVRPVGCSSGPPRGGRLQAAGLQPVVCLEKQGGREQGGSWGPWGPHEPSVPLQETVFVGCKNFHWCSELVASGLLRFSSLEKDGTIQLMPSSLCSVTSWFFIQNIKVYFYSRFIRC